MRHMIIITILSPHPSFMWMAAVRHYGKEGRGRILRGCICASLPGAFASGPPS